MGCKREPEPPAKIMPLVTCAVIAVLLNVYVDSCHLVRVGTKLGCLNAIARFFVDLTKMFLQAPSLTRFGFCWHQWHSDGHGLGDRPHGSASWHNWTVASRLPRLNDAQLAALIHPVTSKWCALLRCFVSHCARRCYRSRQSGLGAPLYRARMRDLRHTASHESGHQRHKWAAAYLLMH